MATHEKKIDGESGFVLLVLLIIIFIALPLLLTAQFELASQVTAMAQTEGRLRSLNLAQNGIEYSRLLLPGLDIDSLLAGQDGVFAEPAPAWRSPVPFETAFDWQPGSPPAIDDGVAWTPQPQFAIESGAGDGHFLLRFSNNAAEDRTADLDRKIIVRSMGIVPGKPSIFLAGGLSNQVTLLEAALRQERVFWAPTPLVLQASGGEFSWEGNSFHILSEETSAVLLLPFSPVLSNDFSDSISSVDSDQFSYSEALFVDRAEEYRQHPDQKRLFEPAFWEHFPSYLPAYATPYDPLVNQGPGLFHFPQGGQLKEAFEGIIVSLGPLVLEGGFHLQGILIQIGEEPLRMEGDARVEGAVWMSSPGPAAEGGTLRFEIAGNSSIKYDPDRVESALRLLPATLLRLRMIYPETEE